MVSSLMSWLELENQHKANHPISPKRLLLRDAQPTVTADPLWSLMYHNPASWSFLSRAQRGLMATGIPVLTYHYLGQPPADTPDPYLYVSPQQFRAQCQALRQAGYQSGTLSELAIACRTGETHRNRFVLTFDDGACNVLEHGMTVLKEENFRAILFVVAGSIGGINDWDAKHGHPVVPLMSDQQIRDWLAAGHEIGSHSLTHRNLAKLGEAEARQQICDSKKVLEDRFGVPIRHFCYPHGKYTEVARRLVEEAGYETACTTRFGVNSAGQDPMTLHRITPLSTSDLLGKSWSFLRRKLHAHR